MGRKIGTEILNEFELYAAALIRLYLSIHYYFFFIISQDYWCALIYLEDIAAVWGLVENLLQGTTPHF